MQWATKLHQTPGRELLLHGDSDRFIERDEECWHQVEEQEQKQWVLERGANDRLPIEPLHFLSQQREVQMVRMAHVNQLVHQTSHS